VKGKGKAAHSSFFRADGRELIGNKKRRTTKKRAVSVCPDLKKRKKVGGGGTPNMKGREGWGSRDSAEGGRRSIKKGRDYKESYRSHFEKKNGKKHTFWGSSRIKTKSYQTKGSGGKEKGCMVLSVCSNPVGLKVSLDGLCLKGKSHEGQLYLGVPDHDWGMPAFFKNKLEKGAGEEASGYRVTSF